jgi:hypothetical protein
MIRSIAYAFLAAFVAISAAFPAAAAEREKNFGLGFIIGEPTGLDGKLFLSNENALEFGTAWSLSGDNEFHLQGDYLFHRYGLFKMDTRDRMPLYFGVGATFVLVDRGDDVVGIRFPVGLSYIFADYPFDIFGAIVPILDVAPDTDFDLEGAIGARFWF